MHPTVMATLAADRHAELLRAADARRRHVSRGAVRPALAARLAGALAVVRGHAAAPWQPAAERCCA